MSEYGEYIVNVLTSGVVLRGTLRRYAKLLLKILWDDDVVVDKIWFVKSGHPDITMRAVCYDENDELCEAIAVWEFNQSTFGVPGGGEYDLVSVDIVDLEFELI